MSSAIKENAPRRLDVVAAIIRDSRHFLLLSKRPEHKHQGGLWEFPGGKVETGETLHNALARELHEELGIDAAESIPFMTIDHSYPDLTVRLHFREVTEWAGVPHGREQQPVEWFATEQLSSLSFPAANQPVVTALSLPDKWLVLPENHAKSWPQLHTLLLEKGVQGVYLRGADAQQLPNLVRDCREAGLKTLVRNDFDLAKRVGADGVHLTADNALGLMQTGSAERDSYVGFVSMACHNEDELMCAEALKADMVTLSPVKPTSTHPEVTPLGWQAFSALASGRPLSVYALGGMVDQDFVAAREHGARGIAGISAFWLNDDC